MHAVVVQLVDRQAEPSPAARAVHLERCAGVPVTDARDCYSREFLAMVDGLQEPRPAVAKITDAARSEGGFLLENCHVIMHTVGRTYAREAGVTTVRVAFDANDRPVEICEHIMSGDRWQLSYAWAAD